MKKPPVYRYRTCSSCWSQRVSRYLLTRSLSNSDRCQPASDFCFHSNILSPSDLRAVQMSAVLYCACNSVQQTAPWSSETLFADKRLLQVGCLLVIWNETITKYVPASFFENISLSTLEWGWSTEYFFIAPWRLSSPVHNRITEEGVRAHTAQPTWLHALSRSREKLHYLRHVPPSDSIISAALSGCISMTLNTGDFIKIGTENLNLVTTGQKY
jgi:hypothetical protein